MVVVSRLWATWARAENVHGIHGESSGREIIRDSAEKRTALVLEQWHMEDILSAQLVELLQCEREEY